MDIASHNKVLQLHTHLSQVEEVISNLKSKGLIQNDYILSILEIENFIPTLFGYGSAAMDKVLEDVSNLLTKIGAIGSIYLPFGRFALIFPKQDKHSHTISMHELAQACALLGAQYKPMLIHLNIRVGSYISSITESNTQDALGRAAVALYESIESNQVQVFFDPESEVVQESYNQMKMARFILDAINEHRLKLAFQPVISAKDGHVESYEALLRIITADNQIITAGPFIPAAEKYGFINVIDEFVLRLVVNELEIDPHVKIALNVSNVTATDKKWYSLAKELLKDEKIAARLTVEITETASENDLHAISLFVENVKSLGCRVAIDDFGAGYTSFKQLKVVSADVLKIDGVFVRDIVDNPESKLFVNILLEFAKAYNLKTVAEFVETGEIAKVLMELGVDYLQGFYFGQALNYRPWIKDDAV